MANYNSADLVARKKLAMDENTPANVLQQLSEDSEVEIRYLVASNPNTSEEVLLQLGKEFPEVITANPVFNLLALENSESRFIKLSLARSSTTSEETLTSVDTNQVEDEEILCAVAMNISTPAHILEELINWDVWDDDNPIVNKLCVCVAVNPKTPPPLLEKLSCHQNYNVRECVAINHNTTVEVLEKLAKDGQLNVQLAVAKNPQTSLPTLEYLAGESYQEIRNATLEHPKVSPSIHEITNFVDALSKQMESYGYVEIVETGTPISILEKLANDTRLHIRMLLAKFPRTPTSVLKKLARDKDFSILTHIIEHPNTTSQVLDELTDNLIERWNPTLGYYYTQICPILINHSKITAEALDVLSNLNLDIIIKSIAKLKTAPSNILDKLVNQASYDIKINFCENPNTSAETLKKIFVSLPESNRIDRLIAIAKHKNTPADILEEIAILGKKNQSLRQAVGINYNTPVSILLQLANDKEVSVIRSVAENPSTPTELLEKLAENKDILIKRGLATNEMLPIDIIKKLSNDNDELVRVNLAKNINTPISILEALAKDPVYSVRESVISSTHTPDIILELLARTSDDKTRMMIVKRQNISPIVLLKLAESYKLHLVLLEKTDLPNLVIEKITEKNLNQIQRKNQISWNSNYCIILSKIAKHPNTPPAILEMLAFSNNIHTKLGKSVHYIQAAVAQNINTPILILEKLSTGSHEIPRKAAKINLKIKLDMCLQEDV